MLSLSQIVIAALSVFVAGSPAFADTSLGNRPEEPMIAGVEQCIVRPSSPLLSPDALAPEAALPAPGSAFQTAGTASTSEPPGPGSPGIPGGPGPPPDDDDDDGAARNA